MNEYEQKKTEQKLPKSCFKCTWAHPWRWEEETDYQIHACLKSNNREIPHELFVEGKRAAWCPLTRNLQKRGFIQNLSSEEENIS